jgi:integrase
MPKYRRGAGSVYKRGKTWWIAYYGTDGTQICESAKTPDKAEARRVLQARLGQLAEGRYIGPAAERVTFDDLAEIVLTDYRVNGKKSLGHVEWRIRRYLRPFFGHKKAHEITTADVKAYIAHRKEEEAANAEVNRELAALKRAFNLVIQAEKMTRKPYFPRLEEDNVRQGFFEPQEYEAVLARLPEYLCPPIQWMYYTGWRVYSEVLPLTWDQIDLDAGTVRLYRGTTKNKEGRVIALPQVLKDIIEQQWQDHIAHYPECPTVFHRNGKPIKNVRGSWKRACKEANLSGKILHDFRRTAVRNLVRAGVPERVAMTITGHKTRHVFERYNIVSAGDLEEAARRIDERIASRTTTKTTTITLSSEPQSTLTH